MLLSNRLLRLMVDAAEMHGVAREDLLRPLGAQGRELLAEEQRIEWGSMVVVYDELFRLVAGDRVKLNAIGRDTIRAPTRDLVRELVSGVVSPHALFRLLERYVTPAFPHLSMYVRFVGGRRVKLRGEIPPPHAECLAFFYVLEGRLPAMTELIGLPPSDVLESRITARTAEMVLELPKDRSLRARARRIGRALLSRQKSRAAREQQRQVLAANIEALQRARDELRVLLDRLPDLVLVHRNGRIVWANAAFVEALEYARLDELKGARLVDVVAPSDRPMVEARILTPRAEPVGRMSPPLQEVSLLARSGAEVRVEAAPGQSVVFDGLPSRLLVARDVTERVRMQQRMIAMDRLASVGLLAAGVAHEVNNPLAYVLNNIELARKVAGIPEEAETSRVVLGIALEGVDRIRSIVRDLLLLARGADTPGDVIDLRPVVESTLALAGREIEQRARLVTTYGPAPAVDASGPRVAQVLLNLLTNALEAMRGQPREESILRVETGRADDGRFFLEVADTGSGIAPHELRRIFEPFFTTKPATQGTGLGLSIAQRLVVDMGGEISVTSERGKGTAFRVLLPAASKG